MIIVPASLLLTLYRYWGDVVADIKPKTQNTFVGLMTHERNAANVRTKKID